MYDTRGRAARVAASVSRVQADGEAGELLLSAWVPLVACMRRVCFGVGCRMVGWLSLLQLSQCALSSFSHAYAACVSKTPSISRGTCITTSCHNVSTTQSCYCYNVRDNVQCQTAAAAVAIVGVQKHFRPGPLTIRHSCFGTRFTCKACTESSLRDECLFITADRT
jgi:hypothetical protein